jgi:hypothetical protein
MKRGKGEEEKRRGWVGNSKAEVGVDWVGPSSPFHLFTSAIPGRMGG